MSGVPVEVTEEAAAHIAQLGMQQELEPMLDWVRQNVPSLREVRVALRRDFGYSSKLPPCVCIWASREDPPGHGRRFARLGVACLESPEVSAPGRHLVPPVHRLSAPVQHPNLNAGPGRFLGRMLDRSDLVLWLPQGQRLCPG